MPLKMVYIQLNNKGYRPNVEDRTNSQTLYELMDTDSITSVFAGKVYSVNGEEYSVDNVSIDTLNFPWGRTFDIYVGVDVQVIRVRE